MFQRDTSEFGSKFLFSLGIAAFFGGSFLASQPARAELSREDYLATLKIADQYVQRHKQMSAANALSSTMLKSLMGRYYKVGDSWEVIAYRAVPTAMRMTNDPEQLRPAPGDVGVFRYEVVEVKNGANPQVRVEVTQLSSFGQHPVDPRVEKLTLVMNDHLKQSQKEYAFRDRSEAVRVSADGMRSRISGLELFPLDVPTIDTPDYKDVQALPELPVELRAFASQANYKADPSRKLTWLEHEDFFGRAIQFAWQYGDPWPTYLKTAQGVAILVHKGAR